VLAQGGLPQHRLRRLMTEVDRRPYVTAIRLIVENHSAREQIRMRERLRKCVDASVTDVEGREIGLPVRERPLSEFGAEEFDNGPLVRTRAAQAWFGELGSTERAQQIVDEFRFLPCEHEISSILRLIGTIERRAASGAFMGGDRLAILGKGWSGC